MCVSKLCKVPCVPRKTPRRHSAGWEPSAPPEPTQCHKCHTCHAKQQSMSSSATPATQSERGCHKVPRLPRKTSCVCEQVVCEQVVCVQVAQSQPSAISATPAAQRNNPCHQVPRLPHKVNVDITKCHACHAKRRGVTAPPGNQARHQSQPSAISATPATQSNNPCHQVPRLPHKVKVDVTKCHACHTK